MKVCGMFNSHWYNHDKQPNGQLSAAPLAGVWSVEDAEQRQLPGNARAADP